MDPLEQTRRNAIGDAMRGKWSVVLERYRVESALRTQKITATGDTLLHMAVSSGTEKVVEMMVDLLGQNEDLNIVLGAENDERNTPLHLAAIRGSVDMCKKIGGTKPSLIDRRNVMGETPLFLAALYGNKNTFLCLHHLYATSPVVFSTSFAHYTRDNDDTILHCAIAEGHIGIAIEIIYLYEDHMCEMMKRNKEGLSPLHILASKPSAFASSVNLNELPIPLRLKYWLHTVEEKNPAVTFKELSPEAEDEDGEKFYLWIGFLVASPLFLLFFSIFIPIGLALLLLFFSVWISIVLAILLLEPLLLPIMLLLFSEEAYQRWLKDIPQMKNKHTWSHQILTKLLEHASDEDMSQTTSRNASQQISVSFQTKSRNVSQQLSMLLQTNEDNESRSGTRIIETPLMIAVKNGVVEMVEKILESFPSRIRDVNADGKNILLLAEEYRQTKVFRFLHEQEWLTGSLFRQEDKHGNNALHLAAVSSGKEITWFNDVKNSMPRYLLRRYNRKMETPEDIFSENQKKLVDSEGEWVAKTSEACSVVSTLVVSVAFATRTNVPGGYDGDKGYAILRNKPRAFETFRESSFAALFFSLISTICFLSIIASHSKSAHSLRYVPSIFYCGVFFMFGSIFCLWISFCAADFFMLPDDTQKLHKVLPTYMLLTCGVTLMTFLQLPKFLRPKGRRFAAAIQKWSNWLKSRDS